MIDKTQTGIELGAFLYEWRRVLLPGLNKLDPGDREWAAPVRTYLLGALSVLGLMLFSGVFLYWDIPFVVLIAAGGGLFCARKAWQERNPLFRDPPVEFILSSGFTRGTWYKVSFFVGLLLSLLLGAAVAAVAYVFVYRRSAEAGIHDLGAVVELATLPMLTGLFFMLGFYVERSRKLRAIKAPSSKRKGPRDRPGKRFFESTAISFAETFMAVACVLFLVDTPWRFEGNWHFSEVHYLWIVLLAITLYSLYCLVRRSSTVLFHGLFMMAAINLYITVIYIIEVPGTAAFPPFIENVTMLVTGPLAVIFLVSLFIVAAFKTSRSHESRDDRHTGTPAAGSRRKGPGMLKGVMNTVVLVAFHLPIAGYVAFAPVLDDLNISSVSTMIDETLCVTPDGTGSWPPPEQGVIPRFCEWNTESGLPGPFQKRLPGRIGKWLFYRSAEEVEELLKEPLASLVVSDKNEDEVLPNEAYAQWRRIACAAWGEFLCQALDITLKKGLTHGVKAFCELPGVDYFFEAAERDERENPPELENLLAYDNSIHSLPYGNRPWFLKRHGRRALDRLCKVSDPALKQRIADLMNQSLAGWKPRRVWPWLPLAYLSANPGLASEEVLEQHLKRTLEGRVCPYMLNTAALFLYIGDTKRIIELMQSLMPRAHAARGADFLLVRTMDSAAFLYWFMMGTAPKLMNTAEAEKIMELESERKLFPRNFSVIKDVWLAAESYTDDNKRRNASRDEEFFLKIESFSSKKMPGLWREIDLVPLNQGHCFMNLD